MIELEPKEPGEIAEELENRQIGTSGENNRPNALGKGERDTPHGKSGVDAGESAVEASEKVFDIEKYPNWRPVWEKYPEQDRYLLTKMIEIGNITPEIFLKLNTSVVRMAQDRRLSEIDPAYGEGNAAAEVSYASREVRLFPEFFTRTEQQQRHIHGHEVGHFLSTHYINPSEFMSFLKKQPSWSNGKYIQRIEKNLPHHFIAEASADYVSDFLHSRSGEEMLQRRLMRSGAKQELESKSEEEINQLVAENENLFAFLKLQFSPDRQLNEETQLATTQQWEWLRLLAELEESDLEETDYIDPVSPEVADDLWQAPASGNNQPKRNWVKWLITSGIEG